MIRPNMQVTCDLGFGFTAPAVLAAEFNRQAAENTPHFVLNDQWQVEFSHDGGAEQLLVRLSPKITLVFVVLGSPGGQGPGTTIAGTYEDAFVWISVGLWEITVNITAPTLEAARATRAVIQEGFPPYVAPERPEKPTASVRFWMLARNGPEATRRTLDVVDWEPVRTNYPLATREQLDKLMAFEPKRSGQIVLFYGPPGTGKTFAIRALAWAWRKWCTLHYIMDVPTFLSATPEYMTTLLFTAEPNVVHPFEDPEVAAAFGVPPAIGRSVPQWRLIVLEDSGELLAENAREQTGAAMARLLNAADGLLGQGSRVMFLITTNEKLDALHPAVARPGRCVAHLNFGRFEHDEAVAWLQAQGAPEGIVVPKEGGSLAELYALLEARQQIVATTPKRAAFGFKVA